MNSPQGFNTLGISSLWVGISLPGLKETFQWRPWWEILRCLELGKSGGFAVTLNLWLNLRVANSANIGQSLFFKYWTILGHIGQYWENIEKYWATLWAILGKYWAILGKYWEILGKTLGNIGQILGKYWAKAVTALLTQTQTVTCLCIRAP